MELKSIKRTERKITDLVMDSKYALLFKSIFQCNDLLINVWVMSVPVVVTVHASQEHKSWSTILWDNTFSEIGRLPFLVTDHVPWSNMANALNMKFTAETGHSLTNENLCYLREKAFQSSIHFNANPNINKEITWTQFCKDPLPERSFTFWDWFYWVMRLTKDHLREPWKEGLINGFISKSQAEEMLLKCEPGTFLLRFSDSILGGISIAYVELNNTKQTARVGMLQPFTHKDFAVRSLRNRIMDLDECVTLYPNIPKEFAFRGNSSKQSVQAG